jgi:GT2 family glycosyltransferase/glycosyltransferase involved in cell wall biosynthesis
MRASTLLTRLFGRQGAAIVRDAGAGQVSAEPSAPGGWANASEPPAFRAESAPQVSIVVPIYNHLEQTRHCLHALVFWGATYTFEVIVVDDGSTDGSTEWLRDCPRVRVHRMSENSGFVAACNAGAAVARGQYLVFLNNDTEVRAGWLDALIGTFDALPHCGLVGAKLIYPDGSLQEAGGIVFADGNACNYGRGGDPGDPRYDFVREVDYCSGACIALPTELFRSLGGFDSRYAPAYYEDTDLAFSVRAAGYQVVYQPRAEVIHFEGVTAGTDTGSGTKRFQEINRSKFVAKQRQALLNQPTVPDYARSPRACATHWRGQRVLVVDADYPHPDRDSGSMRMFHMLVLLRELGCHVMFWAAGAASRDSDARSLEQHGIEIIVAPSRTEALRWWYLNGEELDLVLLSRLPVALGSIRWVRRYAARAKLVFDTVDLHFLRVARGAALRGNLEEAHWAEELRQSELGLMKQAELTLVVSDYEKSLLHTLVPSVDVQVLSNVHRIHGRQAPFSTREGLLFLGNFEHEPNIDAARWLIDEIMPRLRGLLPSACLHIVGYRADEVLADCACVNVKVHGFVADLEPMLSDVKLALAPLRFGAGVKGKINMAMSYGVPVVTTQIGAEGMELVHRQDVLIANDADGFARAIAELYVDEKLWLGLSNRGLENVRIHFSPDIAKAALERVLGIR